MKRIANQETNCYAPKRPRVIQPVFLSKYRLSIALDTVVTRKRDWLPRDWFLSPNLLETHFKVKRAITVFFRAPRSTASRGVREVPFGASVFIHPPRTWFHCKMDFELSEARVSDLSIPDANAMHSSPMNPQKPLLKGKVSQTIMACVFRHELL